MPENNDVPGPFSPGFSHLFLTAENREKMRADTAKRKAEAEAKMAQGIGIDPPEYFELFNTDEWPIGSC